MSSVEGFAVMHDGKIIIETVAPTRQASLINWLVAFDGRHDLITQETTPRDIEDAWASTTQGNGRQLECVEVVVSLLTKRLQ